MQFDPTRVALVDKISSDETLLIRGMDPAVSGTFCKEDILSALKGLGLKTEGKKLIVISVIDNTGERWAWAPELQAFGVDPDSIPQDQWPPYVHIPGWDPSKPLGSNEVGDFYWWPFEGLPDNADPKVFLGSPGWDFSGVVNLVLSLCSREKDAIIYFHCMLGADRTGALHTGYLLRGGMDLQEACEIADKATSAGPPNADYIRLRAAYAASLQGKP